MYQKIQIILEHQGNQSKPCIVSCTKSYSIVQSCSNHHTAKYGEHSKNTRGGRQEEADTVLLLYMQ